MPPKKRAATTAAKATTSKPAVAPKRAKRGKAAKEKEEEEVVVKVEEPVTKDNIISKLKEADKKSNKVKVYLPDKLMPGAASYSVHLDYDCMLNQTNIGANNNKFYIIQVLEGYGSFYCWNRWGRVGEAGQNNGLEGFTDAQSAIKSFEKKFKDKTSNNWANRASFNPVKGKYTLIEMDSGADEETDVPASATSSTEVKQPRDTQPSKLGKETQELISLIYDKDMFKSALQKFDINVKKMPLGKLSKTQIAKGFEVLEEIEEVLKSTGTNKSTKINDLSSKFYTVIPQDFGRTVPPAINTQELLQKKYDMLVVLSDIELAQSMQEKAEKDSNAKESKNDTKPTHPLDTNYELLNCKLEHVDKKSDEFKIIQTYTKETGGGWRPIEILECWKVSRNDEDKRFKEHDHISNRKLLWHGTDVSVVVAILKTGLRIMPHSGGRVGKGIYFASENSKSAGYVGTAQYKNQNIGIMFLNEVALGEEHHITRDDPSFVHAPKGKDCVIARGMTEPDKTKDTTLTIDGKKVTVPQGKPINTNISSSFSQSEYLVYKESQNRIRYLLKMKF